jgi:eukaryotic-like serine/threonine-protein kinase
MKLRKTITISLIALTALAAACARVSATDWPMFLNTPAHSGAPAATVQTPLTLKWSYGVGATVSASPIKVGDKLIVATLSGTVYALNAYTGALAWQFQSTGGGIIGNPASANGKIYFNTMGGELHCISAETGRLLWRFTTSGQGIGSPTIADGRIFIGAGYPNNNVIALDAETGGLLWRHYINQPPNTAPAVSGGTVWIGAGDGKFYGLNAATGSPIGTLGTTGVIYLSSAAILDGTVFAAGGAYDKNVYAFSAANGSSRWTATPAPLDQIFKLSSFTASNGRVFVSMGYPTQKVFALNATTGATLWQNSLSDDSENNILPTPVAAGDIVYAISTSGTLYAYNASTGAQIASVALGASPVTTSPAVADGMIFIAADNGTVKAFLGADSTPPAVTINNPPAGAAINGATIRISGDADEDHPYFYAVEFGAGAAPASWTEISKTYGTSVLNGTLASWTPDPPIAAGTYTIRLTASDTSGNTTQTTSTFEYDNTPPAFAGLQSVARDGNDTSATLSWNTATDDSTPIVYYIYEANSTGNENFTTPFATTTATTLSLSSLNYNQTLFFVVRAKDTFGNMDSNIIELSHTATDTVPPVFAGLQSTEIGDSSKTAVLSWSAATDATPITYYIYKAAAAGTENFAAPFTTTTATSTVVRPIKSGTTAWFVVRAKDAAGNMDANTTELSYTATATEKPVQSIWNPEKDTTIATTAPVITFKTDEDAVCKWSLADSNYADAPNNYCSENAALTTSHSCSVTGLTEGTAKYIYISCTDASGNADTAASNQNINYTVAIPPKQSGWSPAKNSTISTTAPVVTFRTDEDAVCKWSLADSNYADAPNNYCSGNAALATNHSCRVTGLSEGTTKYIYISCKDSLENADTAKSNQNIKYTVSILPRQSGWRPAKNSTISTTAPVITFKTDEKAICRWSLTDTSYAAAPKTYCSQNTALTTSHSCAVTGLTAGANKYVYISCKDSLGNADTAASNQNISYTVSPITTADDSSAVAVEINDPKTIAYHFPAGWNLISIPLSRPDSDSDIKLFALGGEIYSSKTIGDTCGDICDGTGFWAYFPSETDVSFTGEELTLSEFGIPLAAGWNIIGLPIPSIVPIDDAHVTFDGAPMSQTGLVFYQYTGSGYSPATELLPWKGYLINVPADGLLHINTTPNNSN